MTGTPRVESIDGVPNHALSADGERKMGRFLFMDRLQMSLDPNPMRGEDEVRIRLVFKTLARIAGNAPARVSGLATGLKLKGFLQEAALEKPCTLTLPGFIPKAHAEGMPKVVLLRRVLVEPTNEVRDRRVEMLRCDGWAVEKDLAVERTERTGERSGHPSEDLEMSSLLDLPCVEQDQRERHIE
jgi:hypothetical protein